MIRGLAASLQPLLRFIDKKLIFHRNELKPAVYGEKPCPVPHTVFEDIEKAVVQLDSRAATWREMPRKEKAFLFRKCVQTISECAEEIARVSTRHKGSYGQGTGEEYLGLIPIVTYLCEVAECFEKDKYPDPYCVRRSADGTQWIADVCPVGLSALALAGFRGELWIDPGNDISQGKTLETIEKNMEIGVGLVLGAGNQYPLIVLDILHILVMQSKVVICKMNPVNEYMGPILRKAMCPLVEAGFIEFVYGSSKEGEFLVDHPLVKCVHLTGSARTFDSIVWRENKEKKGEPPFKKQVSAELGCVTPYIVVPGKWTPEEIEYQALNTVSGLVNNAGHNCLAAEIVITDRSWPQRNDFLDAIRRNLDVMYFRTSYYPESDENYRKFDDLFRDCENFGRQAELPIGAENGSHHPWKFKVGLSPETCCASRENWCGVLQEVCLDAHSIEDYFDLAEKFVNEQCWGTLSCSVLIDNATEQKYDTAWRDFISRLKYGSICVNVPGMVGFGLTKLTWGAWGDDSQDRTKCIGSGNTKVHNTGFFDNVQKSVVYGPICYSPTPYWFVTNKNCEEIGRAALKFFCNMNILSMAKLLQTALKG